MVSVTLAVPKDLKEQMDEFPIINWSEVARQAISEKIRELKLLKEITSKSRLSENDALTIGKKVKAGIARRHGN